MPLFMVFVSAGNVSLLILQWVVDLSDFELEAEVESKDH